jgi:signal peptidase I
LIFNDQPAEKQQLPQADETSEIPVHVVTENLESSTYDVWYSAENVPDATPDPVTVASDHVFLLGDNRNNSADSRFFGALPIAKIIGKVTAIVDSPDKNRIGKKLSH